MSTRVINAINKTKEVFSDYFIATLKQRLPETGVGSIITGVETPEQLEQLLRNANWQPYEHKAIMPGCVAFSTPIPGLMGMKSLWGLPNETNVRLDDNKNTGKVSAVISGDRHPVDETIILLGDYEGQEVVLTFHPGPPVRPSEVSVDESQGIIHGKELTVEQAINLGFNIAKII